jgi:hypothetical protein
MRAVTDVTDRAYSEGGRVHVYQQEGYIAPDLPERRRRDDIATFPGIDAACPDTVAPDGGAGAAFRGHMAPAWRRHRVLEPREKGSNFEFSYITKPLEPFRGVPEGKHEHFRLMYDLMALAFEGDITRSITFMLGRDLSNQSFPECGFDGGWHGASHHGDKPANIANYAKMNRYHVRNLAYFVEKLKNIPDGDGNVLDHMLIYKGSNMGNSHRHAHDKAPVILVGGVDESNKAACHRVRR